MPVLRKMVGRENSMENDEDAGPKALLRRVVEFEWSPESKPPPPPVMVRISAIDVVFFSHTQTSSSVCSWFSLLRRHGPPVGEHEKKRKYSNQATHTHTQKKKIRERLLQSTSGRPPLQLNSAVLRCSVTEAYILLGGVKGRVGPRNTLVTGWLS